MCWDRWFNMIKNRYNFMVSFSESSFDLKQTYFINYRKLTQSFCNYLVSCVSYFALARNRT